MFDALRIAPSILSAGFMNMERDIRRIEQAGADVIVAGNAVFAASDPGAAIAELRAAAEAGRKVDAEAGLAARDVLDRAYAATCNNGKARQRAYPIALKAMSHMWRDRTKSDALQNGKKFSDNKC